MRFKGAFHLKQCWLFCSEELAQLCYVGQRLNEEQFCEVIFKFGPVVQEILLRDISICSSGGHFV